MDPGTTQLSTEFHIINLIGRLTKDPELRTVGDDQRAVCELRIAVSDGGSDRPTLYIDVSTFDRQAEACAKHLAKGRQVAVAGRLAYREWQTESGARRSKHSVIGRVEFLGRPNGAEASSEREGSAD